MLQSLYSRTLCKMPLNVTGQHYTATVSQSLCASYVLSCMLLAMCMPSLQLHLLIMYMLLCLSAPAVGSESSHAPAVVAC